jgi:hypothetical protein
MKIFRGGDFVADMAEASLDWGGRQNHFWETFDINKAATRLK